MANLMKIIDHDKDGKQVKIRLAAIDCPEKGQSCTNAAKTIRDTTEAIMRQEVVDNRLPFLLPR